MPQPDRHPRVLVPLLGGRRHIFPGSNPATLNAFILKLKRSRCCSSRALLTNSHSKSKASNLCSEGESLEMIWCSAGTGSSISSPLLNFNTARPSDTRLNRSLKSITNPYPIISLSGSPSRPGKCGLPHSWRRGPQKYAHPRLRLAVPRDETDPSPARLHHFRS